jgi:hypothetical protein
MRNAGERKDVLRRFAWKGSESKEKSGGSRGCFVARIEMVTNCINLNEGWD